MNESQMKISLSKEVKKHENKTQQEDKGSNSDVTDWFLVYVHIIQKKKSLRNRGILICEKKQKKNIKRMRSFQICI